MLSLLLDAPSTDRQVRDHVMTLLFAGHDTTTATIAFLFYELARHPEVADAIAGGRDDLLDQALEETLRLYPPGGSAPGAPPSPSSSPATACRCGSGWHAYGARTRFQSRERDVPERGRRSRWQIASRSR